jgi:hypothetical protein
MRNALLILTICGGLPNAVGAFTELTLDARQGTDVFEGIGALSAGASSRLLVDYPEPQRSEILDFLFKPKFGAAIQHLKVEIGGDVNSTDGTEPSIARTREEFTNPRPEYFQRGYEWWLMKEAKRRNPRIIFDVLQWGAPGWIGDGKFHSQDNADFIAAFIKGAKKYHDLDIGYCGCWNEKPYDTDWLKLLRKTLDKGGLGRVKIVAADEIKKWTIADRMASDSQLRDAVQVIGTHYPDYQSTPTARSFGKPVWSNEDGPWNGWWSGARSLAMRYNRNYAIGKMTKTIIWSPVTSYYDVLPLPGSGMMRANQPWSGSYEMQPAIWATAHTTQFIEPGWKYLAGACATLPDGGSCVAAVSPNGRYLSVVVETMDAKKPQKLSFRLAGGLSAAALHVWQTTDKVRFARIADIPVRQGACMFYAVPEAIYSLTTTDGQQRGVTTVPKLRPMPLPYKEDFESYFPGATPRYLSDFYGAFEVADKSDGGKCLKQVITRRGIAWAGDSDPVTVIGSPDWRDYEVSCDVCFDFRQSAWVYGRIATVPPGKLPPTGYALRIDGNGAWQLAATGKKLFEGKADVAPGSWHRFGLRMIGARLAVIVDGKEAGGVADGTYDRGLAGIGSSWEGMRFDNLTIEARN